MGKDGYSKFNNNLRFARIKAIKEGWIKLNDRLNLNMSTQEIIMKTRKLLTLAEDTMKLFGTGDSLLSVSEHYMQELQGTLNRDPNDCKINTQEKKEVPNGKQDCR